MATQYYNLPEIDGESTIDLVNATNGLATATDSALRGVESGIPDVAPLVQGIANAQQTADSASATAGAAQQAASAAAGVASEAKTAADAAGANAASAALAASAADQKAVSAGQSAAGAHTKADTIAKHLNLANSHSFNSASGNLSQLRVVTSANRDQTLAGASVASSTDVTVVVSDDGVCFKAYGSAAVQSSTTEFCYVRTPADILPRGKTYAINPSGLAFGATGNVVFRPQIYVMSDGSVCFQTQAISGAGTFGVHFPSFYFHDDFGDIPVEGAPLAATPITDTDEFKAAVQAAVLDTFSSPDMQERIMQVTKTPNVSM